MAVQRLVLIHERERERDRREGNELTRSNVKAAGFASRNIRTLANELSMGSHDWLNLGQASRMCLHDSKVELSHRHIVNHEMTHTIHLILHLLSLFFILSFWTTCDSPLISKLSDVHACVTVLFLSSVFTRLRYL